MVVSQYDNSKILKSAKLQVIFVIFATNHFYVSIFILVPKQIDYLLNLNSIRIDFSI